MIEILIGIAITLTPVQQSKIVNAIIQVESGGKASAYNKKERAVGCLQIRPVMVRDVNRYSKRKYRLKDRWNCRLSKRMFWLYQRHYKNKSYERTARCWNGGPKGHKKKSTLEYWSRVKRKLFR